MIHSTKRCFRNLLVGLQASSVVIFTFVGANAASKVMGDWLLVTDGKTATSMALTFGQPGSVLAVRCIEGSVTMALMGQKLPVGEALAVIYKTDKFAAIHTKALAVSNDVIEIDATKEMVRQTMTGKLYFLRVTGRTTTDYKFRVKDGTFDAITEVVKTCRLEKFSND